MSKSEKPKMATSWEIYNRIIWDSRLDSSVFIAGFEDRISTSGFREKPLAHWAVDGDIPWHRIRYIRCKDIIVWDREQRLDLISSGHLPVFAWKINHVDESVINLEKKSAMFNQNPVYKYELYDWQPVDNLSISVKSNHLKIASFNVLCDVYEKDKIQTEKRLPAIVEELRKSDADIIAIQEATPDFVQFILAQDWIKDYYYVSESSTAENIQTFGNLLLSRLAFTLVEHKFSLQKHVLVGSWFINNELLQVAVVHLTSNRAQNSAEKRKNQLNTVIDYLQKQSGSYFIVGDFNTRNNLEDDVPSVSNFIDIWQELHPNKAGYTFNPQVNPLAELMSLGGEAARFDRILLHSQNGNWVPQSVELFACEAVANTEEKIFPSDHFGIRAVIENLTCHLLQRGEPAQRSGSPSLRTPLSLARRGKEKQSFQTPLSLIRRGEGGEVIGDELQTISPVYRSQISEAKSFECNAIIPPDDVLPAIQAIPQRYYARFHRWMPHINLIDLVNQIEPKLNQNQRIARQTVLEIVTQACQECLGFPPNLELLGSYRLGVESPESDLDIVCQIPSYLSVENFFKNVQQRLEGLFESIQLVLDAKVPLLRLKLEGISVDLLYTHFDGDSNSEISIIGCWEADLITEFVQEYLPIESFQSLLRAVRGWAKAREVYGNSWGFLGGLSFALLSAWSCQYYDGKDINLDKLLLNFFQVISQHDWNQPIALTEAGEEYCVQLPRDLFPIITSIEPCQNTARNITRSTAEILRREFARGAELTQEIIQGNLNWSTLFQSVDLQYESDIFLEFKAVSNNNQELDNYCGTLEREIIGLVIQLENNRIFVRPWTGIRINKMQNTARMVLGLKLPVNFDLTLVEELSQDFLSQLSHKFEVKIVEKL